MYYIVLFNGSIIYIYYCYNILPCISCSWVHWQFHPGMEFSRQLSRWGSPPHRDPTQKARRFVVKRSKNADFTKGNWTFCSINSKILEFYMVLRFFWLRKLGSKPGRIWNPSHARQKERRILATNLGIWETLMIMDVYNTITSWKNPPRCWFRQQLEWFWGRGTWNIVKWGWRSIIRI